MLPRPPAVLLSLLVIPVRVVLSTAPPAARAADAVAADVPFDPASLVDVSAIAEEMRIYADAIVVTGTKTSRTAIDQPFTVYVLDRARIQDLCAKDLGDLLRVMPGLDVHRLGDRGYGIGPPSFAQDLANQLLVLVDGVAYPTSRGGGADWQLLPVQVDEIERVEYVPGPQTTLYGAYAAMGVINVITRRAAPTTWDDDDATLLRTRVGGDGLARFDLTAHRRGTGLDTTVWATHRSSDGWGNPVDALTGAPHPAFRDQEDSNFGSGGLSVRRRLDDHRALRFDLSYLRSYRSPILPVVDTEYEEDRQDIDTILTYTDQPSADEGFVLTLKKRNSDLVYDAPLYALYGITTNFGRFDDSEVNVRRYVRDRAGRRFSFGGYYEHLLAEGTQYGPGEHNLYEASVDASAEIPLRRSASLLLGINRYGSNVVDGTFTWKAFLRRRLASNRVVRLGYATSVRGPDLATLDYARLDVPVPSPPFPSPWVNFITANPNLDVEEFEIAELGFEHRTDRSSLQFRLYAGTARNLLAFAPSGDPPIDLTPYGGPYLLPLTFVNDPGEVDVLGCTATYDSQLSRAWRLLLSWRYLDAEEADGADRVMSPRNKFTVNATYRPDDRSSFNLTARTTSGYLTSDPPFNDSAPVASHTIFDMALRFRTGATRDDAIFLTVNNLTDRRVTELYSRTANPPLPGWVAHRQAVIGYSIRF